MGLHEDKKENALVYRCPPANLPQMKSSAIVPRTKLAMLFKQPKSYVYLFTIILLAGCAVSSPIQRYSESKSAFSTGPVLMSHDFPTNSIYRVYHQASTGFVPIQSIRQEAEQRAAEFCRRQGKVMVLLGEKISQPPYILGNFPRIEIVFACVDQSMAAGRSSSESSLDSTRLKASGTGFFVTEDGYLLTNFHVVENAHTVKVKYGGSFTMPKLCVMTEALTWLL